MIKYNLILLAIFMVSLNSCRKSEDINVEESSEYPDWSSATHSNDVDPNYSVVFDQKKVLRFDIVVDEDKWAAMQTDLATKIGSGGGPGGPGGPGGGTTSSENPDWFECSLNYEGKAWYKVGIRYKGNSSLQSAYQSGNNKLSFKLDFDEFEDFYPLLHNQRFYGFKQLNLNNNYNDPSLMREKVGADVFRQFGLTSAYTSFCVIYIDHGDGPQYFGVYTLVEEVDNTVLDDQFADGSGNLYKPDGDAAAFSAGSYDEGEMEKKSNEAEGDYTDVKALYDAINNSNRTSDVNQWKAGLEAVFNVDEFMKWLAVNTTIQNWDTYGRMTHNFYLYNNPSNNKLTWIPWDNNEAFQTGNMGGALSFGMTEVNSNWPIIRYLMDQQSYKDSYHTYMRKFIDEVFIPSTMSQKYSEYYDLIKDYAYAEEAGYTFINSDAEFDNAVSTLKSHVQSRNTAVLNYLP